MALTLLFYGAKISFQNLHFPKTPKPQNPKTPIS